MRYLMIFALIGTVSSPLLAQHPSGYPRIGYVNVPTIPCAKFKTRASCGGTMRCSWQPRAYRRPCGVYAARCTTWSGF